MTWICAIVICTAGVAGYLRTPEFKMSQSQPLQYPDAAAASAPTSKPMAMNRTCLLRLLDNFGLPLIFAIFLAVLPFSVEYFSSWQSTVGLALSVSQIGMVACMMMFCLALRDLDLSIGSTAVFADVFHAMIISATDSIALGTGASLMAGMITGGINGFATAKLKINTLITTLAMMKIMRGPAFAVSYGQTIGVPDMDSFDLGSTIAFDVPTPVWVVGLCFVVFGMSFSKTIYGRNTSAIGGNPEVAWLTDASINMTRIVIFLIQGVTTALAGVTLVAQVTSSQPNTAQSFGLDMILACVLDDMLLLGDHVTINGVLVGVLIVGTVQNAMNLLDIDTLYQYLMYGTILLVAVLVDQLENHGGCE